MSISNAGASDEKPAEAETTFERRDPVTRWTDRVPLPVLTLVVLLVAGAVSYVGLALLMPVVPFFGAYLSGWAGSLSCLLLVALWSYMAWSNYRLRLSGWWVTVIAITLTAMSALLTSLRSDIGEMYRRLGTGEQELQRISAMPWIHGPWLTLMTACVFTVFLGFLLFIRRYYVPAQTPTQD